MQNLWFSILDFEIIMENYFVSCGLQFYMLDI